MRKIPTLFIRDENHRITTQVKPECEWVVRGEGLPTRKFDGTACCISNGKFYKRYECKKGKKPPPGFIPAQDPDPITGKWPGWIEASATAPEDKYHIEAYKKFLDYINEWVNSVPLDIFRRYLNGTYELCGPKIQGNPEHFPDHILVKHGQDILTNVPTDYEGLKEYLKNTDIEGIVWHHKNDNPYERRMAKIKKRDFGFERT